MTKLESCASCLDFSIDKVIKVQSSKIPSWLLKHDYVKEFVMKAPNQLKKPSKYDTKVELDLGKQYAGKKVLYWGALPKTTSDPTISDAKKAYSNFQNNGVAKIDKNGKVTFFFMCPQVYKTVAKFIHFASGLSAFSSSPSECICLNMSHPPTNSPSMNTCGIVGQALNSLMPFRSSSEANTLRVAYSTPWKLRICTAMLLNPHCGAPGVPFMYSRTRFSATSLAITACTSASPLACTWGLKSSSESPANPREKPASAVGREENAVRARRRHGRHREAGGSGAHLRTRGPGARRGARSRPRGSTRWTRWGAGQP